MIERALLAVDVAYDGDELGVRRAHHHLHYRYNGQDDSVEVVSVCHLKRKHGPSL